MIEIAPLADHPEIVPTLVAWFRAQWPDYYGSRTESEIAQDFEAEARREGLPLRLVAFVDGALAGTVVLRERAMASLPEATPGLGGLLVVGAQRGRGIGSALVAATMAAASAQGHTALYAVTATAGGLLTRLGWQWVSTITHDAESLDLYRADLPAL